jgi:hypothetical protein
MTPEALEQERNKLLAEIAEAFKDVSRAGGVSWSEARVIDDRGSDEERLNARGSDLDRHWMQLLDPQSEWDPGAECLRFCFLDTIGFHYYLPPAMVLSIRTGYDMGIRFHLQVPTATDGQRRTLPKILSDRQKQCVGRFLLYMMEHARSQGNLDEGFWFDTYASYWASLPGAPQPEPPAEP